MSKIEKIEVTGMTCNHCVMKVEKVLKAVSGVKSASVNLESKLAVVEYESGTVDTEKLLSAVKNSGYEARLV